MSVSVVRLCLMLFELVLFTVDVSIVLLAETVNFPSELSLSVPEVLFPDCACDEYPVLVPDEVTWC